MTTTAAPTTALTPVRELFTNRWLLLFLSAWAAATGYILTTDRSVLPLSDQRRSGTSPALPAASSVWRSCSSSHGTWHRSTTILLAHTGHVPSLGGTEGFAGAALLLIGAATILWWTR